MLFNSNSKDIQDNFQTHHINDLSHKLSPKPRQVSFIHGDDSTLIQFINKNGYANITIVLDKNAPFSGLLTKSLKRNGLQVQIIKTTGGELSKSFGELKLLLDCCQVHRLDRLSGLLIGIGGGAVCDLVGLAASLWLRGIDYILVPTTIIGMVDAAFGGKVGINYNNYKNGIGSFYAPTAVFWNLDYLRSLPQKEYINGLIEILKVSMIAKDQGQFLDEFELYITDTHDIDFLKILGSKETLIRMIKIMCRSVSIKMDFISSDWEEQNLNRELNLGHSIGNPFTLAGISHGCAVGVGILASMKVGVSKGLCSQAYYDRIEQLLKVMDLKSYIGSLTWKPSEARSHISQILDVRGNQIREVIPIDPGVVTICNNIELDQMISAAFYVIEELINA